MMLNIVNITKTISFKKIYEIIFFKAGLFILAFLFPFMDTMPKLLKFVLFCVLVSNFLFYILVKNKIKINIFSLIIFLFSFILILGTFNNIKMIVYFSLFFISYNLVENRKDLEQILRISLFGLIFLSFLVFLDFLGVLNIFYFYTYKSGIVRLWGFFKNSNPNDFAVLFTLILPFAFYFFKKSRNKIFYLISFFLIFLTLIFTQSKAAILPIVFFIPFMFVKNKKKVVVSYVIFIIIVLILIPFIKNNSYSQRIMLMNKGQRDLIWKASIELFLENPLGYYQKDLNKLVYKKIVIENNQYINKPKNTHNLYLYVLLQTGIFGFLLLSLIIFFLFHRSLNKIKQDDVYLYFLIGFLIFFFFNTLHLLISWYYFWIFLGVWNAGVSLKNGT